MPFMLQRFGLLTPYMTSNSKYVFTKYFGFQGLVAQLPMLMLQDQHSPSDVHPCLVKISGDGIQLLATMSSVVVAIVKDVYAN